MSEDDTPTTFNIGYVDQLLHDSSRGGHVIKNMHVGSNLREAFIAEAGSDYVNGSFRGISVTFDAIDPEGISVHSEPAT